MIVTKLGAIDIGSNSVRCLIVNVVYKDGYTHYKKVSMIRLPVRLGQDVFKYGKIRKVTRDRFLEGMKAYEHLLSVHGVQDFRAVATSAMREAKNGRQIVNRVLRKTGIQIETISGKEEARLVFSSKLYDTINADVSNFIYIDVGGGSTEISIIEGKQVLRSKSFKVGGVRLMNELVEQGEWTKMQRWLEKHAAPLKDKAAIGAGGNINKLHKLSLKPVTEALSFEYVNGQRTFIEGLDVERRITEMGLNFDRADVITFGLEIYLKAMQWSGCGRIYVPKIGVSDGLIRDLYHKEFRAQIEQ
ncbi:MAG: exopolyphosphatase [Cryomorphaceae bacterium]|jgi:exopolyphosphatase/guanosine-5'-triphosphate,3'-diphosphate pyrophosphatase